MSENAKWLATVPATDVNFKSHLKYASIEELKEAVSIMGKSGYKGNKTRIAACKKELRKRMVLEEKETHGILEAREIKVPWNGFLYLVIYGRGKDGWFIAIPNWHVSTEAGEPWDEYCNSAKLRELNLQDGAAEVIANAIEEHWEKIRADL